ncbi:MAG: AraC family transcriptional regulator ligand-binding domain-containing protein [Myxococcota bacterium]|nr:AraC family transcriptional regulator ligand-binding domain-containing protein [Myxococcota bacterium]
MTSKACEEPLPQPTISGGWFQYVVRGLESVGVPVGEICRELEIDLDAATDPDVRIPRDSATLLWREAARRSGNPMLGLHVAEHFRLGLNNVLAHLMVSSLDLQGALEALARYQVLVAAEKSVVTLERDREEARVVVTPIDGRLPVSHHQTEFIVGSIAQIARHIAASPIAFTRVRFAHPCHGDPSGYRRFFDCPVVFSARENSLCLETSLLSTPAADRSSHLASRLQALAEEDLTHLEGTSVSFAVESTLRHHLRAGDFRGAHIDGVARELHTSVRSLQRRLSEESQTFAGLFDAVRRDLALTLIQEGVAREAVASRLGFSSTTTLARALRRWQD